jgi:hypothetical protein
MRLIHAAALLALLGAGLVLTGVLIGSPPVLGIEGAYFTRASGTPAYSSIFSAFPPDHVLDVDDENLWLGAGIVCCIQALVLFLVAGVSRRRHVANSE